MVDKCRMEMAEDSDFRITWVCSSCGKEHKATKKFEKSKVCPSCGADIVGWDGLYDDDLDDARDGVRQSEKAIK